MELRIKKDVKIYFYTLYHYYLSTNRKQKQLLYYFSLIQMQQQSSHNASEKRASANFSAKSHAGISMKPPAMYGSSTPVQRKIELIDSENGYYQEMEDGKPASGIGPMYYTQTGGIDNAVFTPIAGVDNLLDILGLNNDDLSVEEYNKNIQDLQGRNSGSLEEYVQDKRFFTDTKEVTDEMNFKAFFYAKALTRSLMRDPQSKRGSFAGRFPDARGTLFTFKTLEEVEEDLGELPETVTYFQVSSEENMDAFRGSGTIESGPYIYSRSILAPDEKRDGASVFTAPGLVGGVKNDNHDSLKDDSLKDSLPDATGDTDVEVEHKAYARKKGRGPGAQIAAMDNWNALGYAGYFKHHGYPSLNTSVDWEWLHIQGAQNGGPTVAANLVAGTSTANSTMIPVEDQINEWTGLASPKNPVKVRYIGERLGDTNLGKRITIKVWAPKGLPGVMEKTNEGEGINASFNPLTGQSFDRMHKTITKAQLPKIASGEADGLKMTKRSF